MKVYLKGKQPTDDRTFGGTIGMSRADLTDETVEYYGMHVVLESFGRALAEQAAKGRLGNRVLGVELHGVVFNVILGPRPNYCSTCDKWWFSGSEPDLQRCRECSTELVHKTDAEVVALRNERRAAKR